MTPAPRPCLVHQNLSVVIALDTASITAVRSADITLTCSDCGDQVAQTDGVPVTVVERTPA